MEKEEIIEKLLEHLKGISFPRLVGSEGEIKANKWVKEKIEELGYEVNTEEVLSSYFRINFLAGASNLLGGILLIIATALFQLNPILFCIAIVIIFYNIYKISSGSVEMGQPPNIPGLYKTFTTENIWAETPKIPENPEIIIMGHYDSKSSKLRGSTRVLFYIILVLCAVVILVIGIIGIGFFIFSIEFPSLFLTIMWVFSGIGLLASIVLCFNVVGNNSPGAADNGTAVALVLQFIEHFKNNPIPDVNLTFLFTTAEEIGLTGALTFIKKRKNLPEWSPQKTFILNYDLAGLKGPIILNTAIGIPRRETSKIMNQFIVEIAKAQQIPIQSIYLPIGGWADFLPFLYYGYQCVNISGKSGLIHTSRDTPEIVDSERLYASFILGLELIKKIAEKNQ